MSGNNRFRGGEDWADPWMRGGQSHDRGGKSRSGGGGQDRSGRKRSYSSGSSRSSSGSSRSRSPRRRRRYSSSYSSRSSSRLIYDDESLNHSHVHSDCQVSQSQQHSSRYSPETRCWGQEQCEEGARNRSQEHSPATKEVSRGQW